MTTEKIALPVRYDREGAIIWTADNRHLLDVRGFGYLTGTGGLNLSLDEAGAIQDAWGEYIAECINEHERLTHEHAAMKEANQQMADIITVAQDALMAIKNGSYEEWAKGRVDKCLRHIDRRLKALAALKGEPDES